MLCPGRERGHLSDEGTHGFRVLLLLAASYVLLSVVGFLIGSVADGILIAGLVALSS